jgi:hypothetical protein
MIRKAPCPSEYQPLMKILLEKHEKFLKNAHLQNVGGRNQMKSGFSGLEMVDSHYSR